MNDFRRNRATLSISIVMALALLAAFAVQYYGIYDLKATIRLPDQDTPFDRLEESGFADILHFDRVESRWSSNMIVHVAAIFYQPSLDFSDAYVVIEGNRYVVRRGDYRWGPDKQEPPDVKWSHWTMDKFRHYKEAALFPPGKFELAQEAIRILVEWMNDEREAAHDQALRDWLYVVVEEARQYEEEWSAIEIDVFIVAQQPSPVLIVTKQGKPKWAVGYDKKFMYMIAIYRRNPANPDWTLDNLLEAGELTEDKLGWMMETGQIQAQLAETLFGPIPYGYEFNHPWQGREIKH